MAFRVTLECGDSSCLRSKKTHEGYTHDWEVFVRGVDNAAIHHYIEKVVFNLHETFPKPKRVIKEPPYSVKESGYAGFDIPIHIYLKNKSDPKRFEIMYNLNLETTVPSVSHVIHHNEIIVNPTDEFRKKLLKGGAIPISSTEGTSEKNEVKTLPMVGKPKLSGNETKKHRIAESKTSNPFNDLFGIPIKTAKISLENKKISEKSIGLKCITIPEKSDKIDKSSKIKHNSHKEYKKEKSSEEKKEKREKEKDIVKEKDKIKEKFKRSTSPSNKASHQSSENRKLLSPSPIKKSTMPLFSKRLSSPSLKIKEKEVKKVVELDKEKEKIKESMKSASDENKNEKNEKDNKSDRKKDKKKHKEDRDKEKKEKYKDKDKERDKNREKDTVRNTEKKIERCEKLDKDKFYDSKFSKEERKSPKLIKEIEKIKDKILKFDKLEKNDKSEKQKESKTEKSEKPKHKHKKRDKKDKRDGSKEREKRERRERLKGSSEKQNEIMNQTSTTLVASHVVNVQERESSESAGSADEDSMDSRAIAIVKKEFIASGPLVEIIKTMSPPPPPISDIKKDRSEKKRDRSKSNREDKEIKKKKKKSESKVFVDEEIMKKSKDRDHSTSPSVEPVSSSQSPIATNIDLVHVSKIKHTDDQMNSEQVAPDSTNSTFVDNEEALVFSEDYVSQLKDLQQKIMTLQDNQELQRVVQVIAETGQYEITKKTFDFDLCALDRRTVQRLQQFFAS